MPTASPTGRVGELPGVRVEAEREAAVVAAGLLPALVGQRHGVGQGGVGQRVRRGVGHRAGHVGHAVEDRVVHLVGRVGVRGRRGCPRSSRPGRSAMSTSTEPGFIRETSSLVTSLGALAPGISTAPMTRSASMHLLLDGELGRGQAVHPVVVAPERHPQLVEVGVEQRDVGAHAERDVGGVLAGDAGADDDDLGVGDAADAAHQHAAAALGLASASGRRPGARGSPATSDIG